MSRIVVGYDGSDGSRASLERAIELAKGIGDSVTVVFGAAAPGIIGGEMASHEADQAQANGFEIEAKMVKEHPVDALLAEAEAGDARMIVVGNQGGPSPIRGAILGAVPFKLVHLSPVPVLVVPPG
jgi:nucleotide-binding universal stress UspA family protein